MKMKDEYFELFFGRKPYYFFRDNEGTWHRVNQQQNNITEFLSESELIMGHHTIIDHYAKIHLTEAFIDLLFDIVLNLPNIEPIKDFLKNSSSLDTIVKLLELCSCDSFGELVSNMAENTFSEIYTGTSIEWVSHLLSAISIETGFFDSLMFENTFYPQTLECCIGDYDFEVSLCKGSNIKYKINDLKEYILTHLR